MDWFGPYHNMWLVSIVLGCVIDFVKTDVGIRSGQLFMQTLFS